MKTCSTCGICKPLTEFHRRADRPIGVAAKCRQCKALSAAEYRAKNIESVRARSLDWHHRNRERSIANTVRWQQEHPEQVRATRAVWRAGRLA